MSQAVEVPLVEPQMVFRGLVSEKEFGRTGRPVSGGNINRCVPSDMRVVVTVKGELCERLIPAYRPVTFFRSPFQVAQKSGKPQTVASLVLPGDEQLVYMTDGTTTLKSNRTGTVGNGRTVKLRSDNYGNH